MLEGGNHYGEKSQAGLGGIQSWSGVGQAAILSRVVRIGPTEEVIERGSWACPWRESSRKRGKGSAILQVGEARWKGRRGEWEWLQDDQKSKAIAWSVHEWKAPGKPFLKWWWGHASCLQECVWSQRAARWCQAQFDVWDARSKQGWGKHELWSQRFTSVCWLRCSWRVSFPGPIWGSVSLCVALV